MPPVSRHQSKKSKPYSNENCSSERRTALSNLNNVILKYILFFYIFVYKNIIFNTELM